MLTGMPLTPPIRTTLASRIGLVLLAAVTVASVAPLV